METGEEKREMKSNTILQGDVLVRLKELSDECIDCIITSPPYYGLRDYGVEGQIGLEPTLSEYLDKMLDVTAELKRVLKRTGTIFWNHGDAYASAPPGNKTNGQIGKGDGVFGRLINRNGIGEKNAKVNIKHNKASYQKRLKLSLQYGVPVACIQYYGLKNTLAVYIRDNRKCTKCQSKENLVIHHIDESGKSNKSVKTNNNPDNLVLLCSPCHTRLHHLGKKFKQTNQGMEKIITNHRRSSQNRKGPKKKTD